VQLVRDTYNERVSDIEAHYDLIEKISTAIGNGGAKISANGINYTITTQQQKILFSSTYLQLYNIVESTVNQLLDAIGRHCQNEIDGDLRKLSDKIRDSYLRHMMPPNNQTTPENRLNQAIKLLQQAVGTEPVEIKISRGGGGNLDSLAIKKLSERIGVELSIPPRIYKNMNKVSRNGKLGILRSIKDIRNELGHGSISFSQCGEGHTHRDFRNQIDLVKQYLEYLIDTYDQYINDQKFLSSP
jgi:hypothetical protein